MEPPTDYEGPETASLACDRCGYVGAMVVCQVSPACHGSASGPPEQPEFEATCPKCDERREVT